MLRVLVTIAVTALLISPRAKATSPCQDWVNSTTEVAEIPSGTTTLFSGALKGCLAMRLVDFPPTLTVIASEAFAQARHLVRVVIPDSVVEIGPDAFLNCTNLTSAVIGRSVVTVGFGTFRLCSSMHTLTILSDLIVELPIGFIDECNHLVNFEIPSSVNILGANMSTHCRLRVISVFNVTSVGAWAFGFCADLTSVTIRGNVSIAPTAFAEGPCSCCTPAMFNRTCNCGQECGTTGNSGAALPAWAIALIVVAAFCFCFCCMAIGSN